MLLLLWRQEKKTWAHVSDESRKKAPSVPATNDGKSTWDNNSSNILPGERVSWSRPVTITNQSSWANTLPKLNKIPIEEGKKPSIQSSGHQDSSQCSDDLQEIESDIYFVEVDGPVTESAPAVDLEFFLRSWKRCELQRCRSVYF